MSKSKRKSIRLKHCLDLDRLESKLTIDVLKPLPVTWQLKILEVRFLVLEQLIFAMIIRADDNIIRYQMTIIQISRLCSYGG